MSTAACRRSSRTAERLAEDSSSVQSLDSDLTFNNITLEQADEEGQTLWKIEAEQAKYSQDEQTATVTKPKGELFQDGKAVFQISANQGEVRQDGEKILLNGEIVAKDLQDGTVLKGTELEWRPEDDILIVRDKLTVTHPQLRVTATEARAYSRDRRIELLGRVVATTRDPLIRLIGERFNWQVNQQLISTDRRVQVEQIQNKQVTDRAIGNRGTVNLKTNVATLGQNAVLTRANPAIQVNSDQIVWNITNQTLVSNQPLTVQQRQQNLTLAADQGRMDLRQNILQMNRNVRAVNRQNQSQLTADSLNWNIATQRVVAEGNVNYRQTNPPLNLTGPRAVGRLDNQTVVVSGGRVVTEIIP